MNQQFLKIREIKKKTEASSPFNTILKVMKIKKRFETKGDERVEFQGGDETGFATCVSSNSPYIQENKVV